MQPRTGILFAAGLAITATSGLECASAAEAGAQAQDLVQVTATGPVTTAQWERRADSYTLHFTYDPSRSAAARQLATTVVVIDTSAPVASNQASGEPMDRGSYFIRNTVANLRGLDPAFCGRTLTLVDGRRPTGGQTPPAVRPAPAPTSTPMSVNQPYPPKIRYGSIEVWLLKADGTQILPVTYSCDVAARPATGQTPVEITYEFPLAESEQAVAAAIRVDGNYYIEKLQRPAAAIQ